MAASKVRTADGVVTKGVSLAKGGFKEVGQFREIAEPFLSRTDASVRCIALPTEDCSPLRTCGRSSRVVRY